MEQVLLVDGYNMIGAWPELTKLAAENLEDARDRLVDMLAEYRAFSGKRVIVVFDAHQVPGTGNRHLKSGVEVIYTREKETADECIERLAGELSGPRTVLQVATSDYTEQRVAFGRGALRLSARELLFAVEESRASICRKLEEPRLPRQGTIDSALSDELKRRMEQWRRGDWKR